MGRKKVESLAVLATYMSGQYGISVESRGTDAYSYRDDQGRGHIVVPALAGTEDELALIRGYIDHEVAHLIFTDWQYVKKCCDNLVKNLHNIYEDVLVERLMSNRFPGCRTNLTKLNTLVLHDGYRDVQLDINDPRWAATQLINYVLARAASTAYSIMEGDAEILRNLLVNAVPADVLDGLDTLIDRVRSVCSSADTYALAQDTAAYLRQYLPDNQDQNGHGQGQNGQDQNGQGQGQSDQSDQSGQSGQSGQSDQNGQDQNGQDQNGQGQEGAEQCQGQSDQSQNGQGQSGQGQSNQDQEGAEQRQGQGQNGQRILQELENSDSEDMASRAARLIQSEQERNGRNSNCFAPDDTHYRHESSLDIPVFKPVSAKTLAEAEGITAALRQRMTALLQSRVVNREGRCRRGRIDTHRLARLAVGDARIFERRTEKIDIGADIMILVDASGSMDYANAKHIMTIGLSALVKALRLINGVRVASYAFGGDYYVKLTDYNDPISQSNLCMHEANGTTPAGSAMHNALQHMMQHSRPNGGRKILLIMTDGSIDDEDVFYANLDAAKKLGIEVIGLGIENCSIEGLLPDGSAVTISKIAEFPKAIFELLQNKLLEVK